MYYIQACYNLQIKVIKIYLSVCSGVSFIVNQLGTNKYD